MPSIENPHGIHIDLTQFTDNVEMVVETDASGKEVSKVVGTGIFDTLMMVATEHLNAQYDTGRIRGEDYSNAYVQIYQATLQAAVQIWLQKPLAELQEKEIDAKIQLYYRQIEGFTEDYKQKLLKTMLDSWAIGFSVARDSFLAKTPEDPAGTGNIPAPMQKGTINQLFNELMYPNIGNYKYKEDSHPNASNRDKTPFRKPIDATELGFTTSKT